MGLPLGKVSRGLEKRVEVWFGEDQFIQKTRLAHDEYGNVVVMRDARGYDRKLYYDELTHRFPVEERLILDNREIVMRASYDQVLGVITSYEDPNGNKVHYYYDALSRITSMVQPGDSKELPTVSYEYDLGNPISAIWTRRRINSGEDKTLDEVSYYDGLGRLQSRRQPAEEGLFVESVANIYDARGMKAAVFKPRFVETFEYKAPAPEGIKILEYRDALGRNIKKLLPDGAETYIEYLPLKILTYDENDTDPLSPHFETPTVKHLDGLGRTVVTEEDPGDGNYFTRRYIYNAADNLLSFEDAEGNIRRWEYDGLGRRIKTHDKDAGSWSYEFDEESNEIARTDPLGGKLLRSYDGGGRILFEKHEESTGTTHLLATYHYDEPYSGERGQANTIGKLSYVEDTAGIKAYLYDERGRVTKETRTIDNKSYSLLWDYDAASRVRQVTYPDGKKIGYTYNERSLVKSIGGIVLSQKHGAAGELLEREYGNGVKVKKKLRFKN